MEFLSGLYLVVIAAGAASSLRRTAAVDDPSRWVILQIVLGFIVLLTLSRLAAQARYFTAIMPGVFVLLGIGLHAAARLVSAHQQWGIGGLILVASVFGGWFSWPAEAANDALDDRSSTLTLLEQSEVVTYARTIGLASHRLESQLHGPVYGGLTAIRWIDFARELPEASVQATTKEVFVAPAGFPGIPPLDVQQRIQTGPGHALVMGTFDRRFDSIEASVSASCPIRIPYRWGALTAAEYREFGILRGMDIERCRGSRDTPLTLRIRGVRSESLYLLLSWYDVARDYPSRAQVTIQGGQLERISGPVVDQIALYRVVPTDDMVVLVVQPLDTIASIDVY